MPLLRCAHFWSHDTLKEKKRIYELDFILKKKKKTNLLIIIIKAYKNVAKFLHRTLMGLPNELMCYKNIKVLLTMAEGGPYKVNPYIE